MNLIFFQVSRCSPTLFCPPFGQVQVVEREREKVTQRDRGKVGKTDREGVTLKDRGKGDKRECDLERQQVILRNRRKGDQIESDIERQGEKGKRVGERERERK
jgi:hypothetical protein